MKQYIHFGTSVYFDIWSEELVEAFTFLLARRTTSSKDKFLNGRWEI
jgi:hypothetical protein